VWREGAKFAFHAPSGTEIPLVWDPIYQKYAWRFLEQFAARYDNNPNLLFVDVTPGAETNPYRFARINITHPEFKDEFEKVKASDGRNYSEELWLETIKQWVDASDRVFQKTPLLVTLNVGGLRAADRSVTIGDYCVAKGFYVGQNGLSGRSYLDSSGGRTAAFHRWSKQTKLFFEMVAGTGGRTGTLMEVMQAAERIGCSYLNVYPEDVLRGTRGQPDFDPEYERALEYGARVLSGKPTTPALADALQPAPTQTSSAAAAPEPERAPSSGKLVVKDFQLQGERWTCQVDGRPLSGILLKPEGKGPFPAVLISHGLGGSAESFGLSKAREMVKWGLVCIAPNYTHNVGGGPRSPSGKPPEPGQRAGKGGKGTTAAPQRRGAQPSDFGASEENIRRALACVEILRGLPDVDARRLAAYGHSMGGFVTVGLAAAVPDLLKAAAISGSGVAPQAGFPAPSAQAAEKIRTPLLILHGGSDPVVRPAQSDLLKQVLDRNQVPNERHVFEGQGHPIDQTNRDDVFQRMRAWFSRHGVL
jgi:dienelactone hydrolase